MQSIPVLVKGMEMSSPHSISTRAVPWHQWQACKYQLMGLLIKSEGDINLCKAMLFFYFVDLF